jgi:hypothetical protein
LAYSLKGKSQPQTGFRLNAKDETDANFYRAADGLFHNEQYRSVDVVVTFIGESPHEALANPNAMQGKHCLAIAALNEFQPTD